jgi:hypothetical protein
MDARFRVGLESAWQAPSAENTTVPLTFRDYMDGIWARVCDEIDRGPDHPFPMIRSWQLTGCACGVAELTVSASSWALFANQTGLALTWILANIEDRLQRIQGDKFLSLSINVVTSAAQSGEVG